ncbi:hypothetical protein SAMN02745249_01145 [Atopostipes suicloacalis DSM 15692]|uniref:Uncharacterized protein n=1 Tax=Atopostipes suicloacalis DSM 15692 TaxID=1121025 RepID=A0A1M4WCF7_9LACT|nr:hypothetical protein SAMN02745249_01145 [Atopostipes suicloacalis DSM 15692]
MDDKEGTLDFYRDESPEIALHETEEFIQEVGEYGKNIPQGEYILQRILYLSTQANIKEVYVQGHLVHKR